MLLDTGSAPLRYMLGIRVEGDHLPGLGSENSAVEARVSTSNKEFMECSVSQQAEKQARAHEQARAHAQARRLSGVASGRTSEHVLLLLRCASGGGAPRGVWVGDPVAIRAFWSRPVRG